MGVALHDDYRAVGPLERFALDAITPIELDGRTIAVIRTASGVFAIGSRCPHQGAPLCAGRVTGTMLASERNRYVYGEDALVVRCPWHGFEFDVRSGLSFGAVIPRRVPVFGVEVRDGVVYCSPRPKRREIA
jgi:nitrite reductase (NADH) small subunit